MSSEGKNIDQVFREKVETFNPGNAMLDADWSRMKGLLPVAGKTNPVRRKLVIMLLKVVAAAAAVAALFFIVRNTGNKQQDKTPVAKTPVKEVVQPIAVTDTTHNDTAFHPKFPVAFDYPMSMPDWQHLFHDKKPIINFTVDTTGKYKAPVVLPVAHDNNNAQLVQQLYDEVTHPVQSFEVNNRRDTAITCRRGTNIYIPANTFYSGNGLPVDGDVALEVREYYSLGDMVAAKLNTTSDGKLLKSGGMLFINATFNNSDVYIGNGKKISVQMPANGNADPQMQLFLPGEQANTFSVNKPAPAREALSPRPVFVPNNGKDSASLRMILADTTRFPNIDGINTIWTGFSLNTQNNFQWKPAGQFQGGDVGEDEGDLTVPVVKVATIKVLQPYKVSGNTETATFLTGHLDEWEKDSIQRELHRLHPDYKTIKLRSSFVGDKKFVTKGEDRLPQYIEMPNDSTWIPLKYAVKKRLVTLTDSARVMREYDRRNRYNTNISLLENKYRFSLKKLGWINCDRFYNDAREKVDFTINLGADPADFVVRLVFPRINAISGLSQQNGNSLFFNELPSGEPVTIIAIGARNGKTVGCFMKTTISKTTINNLACEPIDATAFKQKLAQLNQEQ
jgi:hypothetical protein